jgi:RNA polymerase sigma-70 factor (ECF subfamily)
VVFARPPASVEVLPLAQAFVLDPHAQLLKRAAKGDRAAAGALVAAVSPRLWRLAWRMLRDQTEAEDVVQEALIRLWSRLARWRFGEARVETWLYRVTTNLCLDRLRKSGRFVDEDAAPEGADPSACAETVLIAEEARTLVDAAITALPDRQRAAILLSHFEGLAAAQVGEVLDCSVEAVESLLSRARRALRASLEPQREALGALIDLEMVA